MAARDGTDLMADLGYQPTNKYLPPRARGAGAADESPALAATGTADSKLLQWIERLFPV